jgi:hypothetical protein
MQTIFLVAAIPRRRKRSGHAQVFEQIARIFPPAAQ